VSEARRGFKNFTRVQVQYGYLSVRHLQLSFDVRKHIFRFLERGIFGQQYLVSIFLSCLVDELLIIALFYQIIEARKHIFRFLER